MSKITAQVPSTPPAVDAPATPLKTPPDISLGSPKRSSGLKRLLIALSSLRLTVGLLAFSVLLVFFGTLAQMDEGLYMVLHKYFRTIWIAWIPLQTLVRFGQIFLWVPPETTLSGSFPLPGGWMLGAVMLVNLISAYFVRYRYSWKRAGIPILHSGIVLLMVGELYAGTFQVEGRMRIRNGQTSNFVEDHRKVELAVIDTSDPKEDAVVAVPGSRLKPGSTVSDDRLPFDVEVVKYMDNSTIPDTPQPGEENLATAGDGLRMALKEAKMVTGVDGNNSDHPAAYVTLKEKGSGRKLGTYLVTTWFTELDDSTQTIQLGNRNYEVALRPERTYKPYTFKLKEFRHDIYPGTEVAKNYSSLVTLTDPSRSEDREVKIYMNNPLRYEGETFYQSGVLPGDSGTILQVVQNRGWLAPYFACFLVAGGLLYHFGSSLISFLQDLDEKRPDLPRSAPAPNTNRPLQLSTLSRFVPWAAFALGGIYVVLAALPPQDRDEQMHLEKFAQLPVLDGGRIKPMDTVARNSLLAVSNRQDFRDKDGRSRSAVEWLLDTMTSSTTFKRANSEEHSFPIQGEKDKVFRIENIEVLNMLGLPDRPGDYRYSIEEIAPKWSVLAEQDERMRKKDPKERTKFEEKLAELTQRLKVYLELAEWQAPLTLPPGQSGEEWRPLGSALSHARRPETMDAQTRSFLKILHAYALGDVKEFNTSLDEYASQVHQLTPEEAATSRFETFFNHFEPFLHCLVLYILAFTLTCGGWVALGFGKMDWSQTLNRSATALIVLALVLQSFGIWCRMWIMDRFVPITNLYSTAVFIGWGSVLLGLILERLFRLGIGNCVASALGFLTAIIAHHLAHGDTMEVLQPVLDTNFWLATHVTTINFGYAATFVAGMLGMLYITVRTGCLLIYREPLNPGSPLAKVLSQMIYGIVCFALFLSFVGTVLGGIWADQSWGRFWGWDPKENGALLIVLMNAIVLHARWGGMVKQMGIAMLTVGGMMITGWSWFGTNQLGVGLHAYGFNKTLAAGLTCFWFFELAVLAVGFIVIVAERMLRSNRRPPPTLEVA